MSSDSFISNEQVAKDLRSIIEGDVLSTDISRQLYSTAACIYELTPLVIVVPKDAEDVVNILKYSSNSGVPITARGAGTGLAGAALGTGIILDFTKYMNRLIGVEGDVAVVQPGLVYGKLNKMLRERNRCFAPDPSSGDFCSIGGMLGTNAAGPHTLKYGSTKDWIESLTIVTADGEVMTTSELELDNFVEDGSSFMKYAKGVREIIEPNIDLIESAAPNVNKNSSGYNVYELIQDDKLDINKLLIGSEGTLGIVTEAKLRLTEIPKSKGFALVSCANLEKAGESINRLMELSPAALDMIDDKLVELSVSADPRLREIIPSEARFVLFAEFFGETDEEVKSQLEEADSAVMGNGRPAFSVKHSTESGEMERLWSVRKSAVGILSKIKGDRKPVPFAEDGTVHYSLVGEYLRKITEIFKSEGVEGTAFGHAGNGNLHIRPMLDLRNESDLKKMVSIAKKSHEVVKEMNGTMTGEHADGIARTPYMKEFFPELYPLFEQIKKLFDPNNLMNPGKIVSDKPQQVNENLRYGIGYAREKTDTFLDDAKWTATAELCHGCGTCIQYCPVSIATNDESSTARAKANLLRGVLSGKLDPDSLLSLDMKSVIDECVNCKLCLVECPTEIDIPGLAQRARALYVSHNGISIRNRILGATKQLSELSTALSPLSNLFLSIGLFRKLIAKLIGIHPDRKIQKFRRGSLQNKTFPEIQEGKRDEVVYFGGCHAHYSDPRGELKSTIRLFEKIGVKVRLPEWRCCGAASLSLGQLESAASDAKENVGLLLPFVRKGMKIITSSGSCGYALKYELPELVDSEEAREVAAAVVDLYDYLGALDSENAFDGEWSRIEMKVVYHQPCQHRAQNTKYDVTRLLKKIPGMDFAPIEKACCGIAGTLGYKLETFDLSMKIGEPLFDDIKKNSPDFVLTGTGTCQMQISQGTDIPTIHPVVLLNRSYSPPN
ncbi:MAG: anaerobic glycerol-3-phosphate dehydrogenase subunit C [Candidatus Marinimicrobia bacterium]|nr:anaerobic glycerol-3-phosphate dehydrogenase subunit C [Candidatus Neomarinimicrobiota bacterium]